MADLLQHSPDRAAAPPPSFEVDSFFLTTSDDQTVRLPRGAVLLDVAMGRRAAETGLLSIEVWYHYRVAEPIVARRFRIITGNPHAGTKADVDPLRYFRTAVLSTPGIAHRAWHVFDLGEDVAADA